MLSSWSAPIDHYCERTDASFWSEPLNAVSNGAFLVAAAYALLLWRRGRGRDVAALWLILVTAMVGIGSFLFHTFANRWSLLADVLPIAVFIYSYFLLAMRRYLGLGLVPALGTTVAFILFNTQFGRLWGFALPETTLNGSVGYLPAALALLAVGGVCLTRNARVHRASVRRAGRALLWAALIFCVSLVFRSIDRGACAVLPLGTHAIWHFLNAAVLFALMRAAILFPRNSAPGTELDPP